MAEYKVNADLHINVEVEVEAENEDCAREEAHSLILEKMCEFKDPIDQPKINWVEKTSEDEDEEADACEFCGSIL